MKFLVDIVLGIWFILGIPQLFYPNFGFVSFTNAESLGFNLGTAFFYVAVIWFPVRIFKRLKS